MSLLANKARGASAAPGDKSYNHLVLVSDFNYSLPRELIAQEPLADRSASRLLHLNRGTQDLHDRQFRDFPDLLCRDDLVVFNNWVAVIIILTAAAEAVPERFAGYRPKYTGAACFIEHGE